MRANTSPHTVGLPEGIVACLFDMDGVLTDTAAVHAAAWQRMFDEYLKAHANRSGEAFVPFDPVTDYDSYVDGRPRLDGTRAFLASRGIRLPEGGPDDPPDAETVHALGNRKNQLVLRAIAEQGVRVYPGSRDYLTAAHLAGLSCAVVSSSSNARDVLAVTGLDAALDARVDGVYADRAKLPGKPAPDTFLAAARALDVPPEQAAVFEDAQAGVAAGRAGGFAFVVGVNRVAGADRAGQAEELRRHGADIVVDDLADLLGVTP